MKRAIVLAGGGSKGAYQIGAWKALRELNIEYSIVTGTSIGAINGVMMVQDDFEKAYHFWEELSIEQVFQHGLPIVSDMGEHRYQKDQIIPFLKEFVMNKGADISPLIQGLYTYLDEKRFMESPIDFGLMTVRFPSMVPVEIKKEDIKPGMLQKWVLASASCFPAFPLCKVEESSYIDGGYYDNLPIDTAFRLGAEEVVAIALKPAGDNLKYAGNPLVTMIEPTHPLGSFLAFERNGILNNMNLGYQDTLKVFHQLVGKEYAFLKGSTQSYEAIAKKLILNTMRLELGKDCSGERCSFRGDASVSAMDRILGTEKTQDLFSCFLVFLENCMKYFEYTPYQIYKIEDVIKNIVKDISRKRKWNKVRMLLEVKRQLATEEFQPLIVQVDIDCVVAALFLDAIL